MEVVSWKCTGGNGLIKDSDKNIIGGDKACLECPSCNSKKVWKEGKGKRKNGLVQRYVCGDCDSRFCGELIISASYDIDGERQVGVTRVGAKNLIVAKGEELAAGDVSDIKSILFQFAWWM